jgi:hypothetical protein
MTSDVSPDIVASFNSLVDQRGGGDKFSDFQLDCALAAVEILRDVRSSSLSPSERSRAAREAANLLELLPAPIRQGAPAPPLPRRNISDVTLLELASEYQRTLAGDPSFELGYDDDVPRAAPAPPSASPAPEAPRPRPSAPEASPAPPQAAEPLDDPRSSVVAEVRLVPVPRPDLDEPTPRPYRDTPAARDPRLAAFTIMHRPFNGGDAA